MNYSVYRISLDIHKTESQLSISVRQGETKRRLCITLVEGGAPYVISKECYAVFSARKPDGTVILDGCTIQDNTIIFDFETNPQITAAVGRCECDVSLYGYDNEELTSPKFACTVYATVGSEEGVISTDEVTALRTLITEANSAIGRANSVTRTVFRFSAHSDGTDFSESWNPGMLYIGFASVPMNEPDPTDKEAYEWAFFANNVLEILPVTLSASAWRNGEQSVEAMLLDESALIPSPADADVWVTHGLRLENASEDSMTFTCKVTPKVDIVVNELLLLPTTYALPKTTTADQGKYLRVGSDGKWNAYDPDGIDMTDVFVIRLSEDETKLANTTWVDIGSALYNGKVLELRYKKGIKEYRSCEYLYTPADAVSGVLNDELLFFVPYAEHGNGYTFPGRKIVKITGSGVSVKTEKFGNISI